MNNCLITNALVLPMTEERESFAGYVRVTDGIIADRRAMARRRVAATNRLSTLPVVRFCPGSSMRIPISTKFCCARCGKIWN